MNLNHYRDIALLAYPTPKGDEEGKGYRIEHYGSTKSYGGQEDYNDSVGQPRRVLTNPKWPVIDSALCVARDSIVDLTGKLDEKSNLQWDVPAGNWTIMRFGHTPTGVKNRPATPEGEGLECDKLSKAAMDAHFAGFVQKLIDAAGPEAGKTFGATHIDSWEVGTQNWTPLMRQEFLKRCGYDLLLANKMHDPVRGACLFRASGKRPELWRPETGRIEQTVAYSETNGCVSVQLRLESTESVFVVFWEKAPKNKAAVADKATPELKAVQEIAGPWDLRFPPNWGAPEKVTLEKLISWTEHADVGVKHFSGTAVYSKTITVPANLLGQDKPLYLDLGSVAVIAEVKLNGKDLAILWKRPFRVNVSAAAKAGENALEVKVVNLWPNRLIRDSGLPEKDRLTWSTWNPYRSTDPLLPSGLLGPVRLMTAEEADIK